MKKRCLEMAAAIFFAALLVVQSGCSSVGPKKMHTDRANYNTAITESWKQQVLLNIVKIRYVEPLFFVDIGDIVAGYTLETAASADFTRSLFDIASSGDSSVLELGLSARYIDRPTITYKPMTGAPFRKAVLSPIPIRNVMLGLDSGISAEFLVSLGVRSINGLRNGSMFPRDHQSAAKEFRRAVEILSQLQLANAVHVRSDPPQNLGEPNIFLCLGGIEPSAEATRLVSELRTLLNLDPAVDEYEVVGGPYTRNRKQIALQAYSLMQIMGAVAARVDIPEEDIVSRCAISGMPETSSQGPSSRIAVRSSTQCPEKAFAKVKFHDHWFWVDDRDLHTKRVFSFLMLAFTLMEQDAGSRPLVTIPIQ